MALLESITIGTYVLGIDNSNAPVTVISVKWHGTNALTVTYRSANGTVGEQILYREDEPNLQIASKSLPWSFDADAGLLRLASEA